MRTTIPAHVFEPAKRVTSKGTVDDDTCGYVHRLGDDAGVFCAYFASSPVHNGTDVVINVADEEYAAVIR